MFTLKNYSGPDHLGNMDNINICKKRQFSDSDLFAHECVSI